MNKGRLEAFSDGVLAIAITIMVLEMKAPQTGELESLRPVLPALASYVLSFLYVGIYWNNHHHLFQSVQHVNGATLWGNLHLLFWLSLIPFVTRWMGGSQFATWPVVAYGLVLFMSALAWEIERRILLKLHTADSSLVKALGANWKEGLSLAIYAVAIACAFVDARISCALYALVAVLWFVPEPRVERALGSKFSQVSSATPDQKGGESSR